MTDAAGHRIGAAGMHDAGDVAALAADALHEAWSEDTFARELAAPGAVVCVARGAGGELVGFVVAQRVLDELHVLSLAVAAARRRRGVGRALLDAALGDPPARSVLLEVRASNDEAQRFYGAIGFEAVGRRRGYYGDGEDALLLTRGPAPSGARMGGVRGGSA